MAGNVLGDKYCVADHRIERFSQMSALPTSSGLALGGAVPLLRAIAAASRDAHRTEAVPTRVLVVDDESPVREFVDRTLRNAGYETAVASDGPEAIETAEKLDSLDLLLTDVMMPQMKGDELARRLRHLHPSLKVLYLTAYCDQLFKAKVTLWEDEAFLDKPCTVRGVLEAVSLLLFGELSTTQYPTVAAALPHPSPAQPEPFPASLDVDAVRVPAPMSERKPFTILVVDDDLDVTGTFARMLALEGYGVQTALTAEAGLREAEINHPDAILLDLRMPLVDGLAFLKRLRAREEGRQAAVAIITGDYFLDDTVLNELRTLGADVHFKPVWLEELIRITEALVSVSH